MSLRTPPSKLDPVGRKISLFINMVLHVLHKLRLPLHAVALASDVYVGWWVHVNCEPHTWPGHMAMLTHWGHFLQTIYFAIVLFQDLKWIFSKSSCAFGLPSEMRLFPPHCYFWIEDWVLGSFSFDSLHQICRLVPLGWSLDLFCVPLSWKCILPRLGPRKNKFHVHKFPLPKSEGQNIAC